MIGADLPLSQLPRSAQATVSIYLEHKLRNRRCSCKGDRSHHYIRSYHQYPREWRPCLVSVVRGTMIYVDTYVDRYDVGHGEERCQTSANLGGESRMLDFFLLLM